LNENISHTLQEILTQLNELNAKVAVLSDRRTGKPVDREFLPLADAAHLVGRSVRGLQSWLGRCANDPDKPSVRRLHGRVHRADLLRLAEASRKVSRGELVNAALERRTV
jgi:hypothetical protein